MRVAILVASFLSIHFLSSGQSQIVVLNHEKVLVRFRVGDDITYKLKGASGYETSFVADILEFSFVTFNDTISFTSVERVSVKNMPLPHGQALLSKFLITAGIAYFTIDQFNNIVVHGQPADLDPTVWKPSLAMVAGGLALKFIRKKSQRIRYPGRMMTVERGSKFYKEIE